MREPAINTCANASAPKNPKVSLMSEPPDESCRPRWRRGRGDASENVSREEPPAAARENYTPYVADNIEERRSPRAMGWPGFGDPRSGFEGKSLNGALKSRTHICVRSAAREAARAREPTPCPGVEALRHGGRHDVWTNLDETRSVYIPRHREINKRVARATLASAESGVDALRRRSWRKMGTHWVAEIPALDALTQGAQS